MIVRWTRGGGFTNSCENRRTLLHLPTRARMCGALFDLRAAFNPRRTDTLARVGGSPQTA